MANLNDYLLSQGEQLREEGQIKSGNVLATYGRQPRERERDLSF